MSTESDRQAIIEHEQRRCAALTSGDIAALGELVSDDLVHVHGNGHFDGKADYLSGVETKYIFHRIDRGELSIRVYGDIAVVVGPLDQIVEVRGIDKRNQIKAVATQSWVRRGDGWQQNTCAMAFLSVS
jgi:ketosteroid isomerase-like protein